MSSIASMLEILKKIETCFEFTEICGIGSHLVLKHIIPCMSCHIGKRLLVQALFFTV